VHDPGGKRGDIFLTLLLPLQAMVSSCKTLSCLHTGLVPFDRFPSLGSIRSHDNAFARDFSEKRVLEYSSHFTLALLTFLQNLQRLYFYL
jgi:hypothetical protein